jgi:outer membrane protein OmpA-like peptidoglycan-associated protein
MNGRTIMLKVSTLCALAITSVAATTAWADPDADGCKDFFVSRMAGYYIRYCDMKDFDSYKFMDGTDHEAVVEGKIVHLQYAQPDDATANSGLKVQRNYINALTTDGWTILDQPEGGVTAKQIKNGKERWVELGGNGGSIYDLVLAEKAGMAQSVVTADDMSTVLNRDGRISLQINFDTAKSTIRNDSLPIIQQIVATMKANPALKLSVEGHTDNVGTPQSNKTLSLARAQAVVTAVSNTGVAAARMTPVGYGQEQSVADNGTEQGRAQNRRVVLVKQ